MQAIDNSNDLTYIEIASVTADGNKTYSQLLDELYATASEHTYTPAYCMLINGHYLTFNSSSHCSSSHLDSTGKIENILVRFVNSGSSCVRINIDSSNNITYASISSIKPSIGDSIKLFKLHC